MCFWICCSRIENDIGFIRHWNRLLSFSCYWGKMDVVRMRKKSRISRHLVWNTLGFLVASWSATSTGGIVAKSALRQKNSRPRSFLFCVPSQDLEEEDRKALLWAWWGWSRKTKESRPLWRHWNGVNSRWGIWSDESSLVGFRTAAIASTK